LSWDEEEERVEFKEIVWGDLTRKKAKVIRLKLKNGKCLKLTEDHKVLTNLGWIEAGDLKNYKKIKVLSVS
jgi:intein/homing endonuclease